MILRVVDKEGNFIRDDFTFVTETEIGLDVPPAQGQGFYSPKWNGTEWIEGLTDEEILEITKPVLQKPTVEERLNIAEDTIMFMLMGGM